MVHHHAGSNNLKYKHNLGHPPMVGPVIDPSFVLFPSLFQSPIFSSGMPTSLSVHVLTVGSGFFLQIMAIPFRLQLFVSETQI